MIDKEKPSSIENLDKFSLQLQSVISSKIYNFLDNRTRRYPLLEVVVLSNHGAVKPVVAGLN
jgi:hypothetical protein